MPEFMELNKLMKAEARRLEELFTELEIHNVLLELGRNKAPGLDGFTINCSISNWTTVKINLLGFLSHFHESGKFTKEINSTFLVLIPKRGGAEELKDFSPISLWAVSIKYWSRSSLID